MVLLSMSQRTSKSSKQIKLHLGCGAKYIPGFIHIDQNPYDHLDYISNVAKLSMFPSKSVDLIYASHLLEYFHREEVDNVLAEWYRVLYSGGLLRLAVPDFDSIIKVYLKYSDLDHRGILGPLYGKWPQQNKENAVYHRTVYDYKSLKRVLERTGFNHIKRYDWRKTEHADVDDYSQAYIPHMDRKNGIQISLNVEAMK